MDNNPEKKINLSDYILILYRGRWIILLSFLIVMGGTAYYTFTAQPIYQASAKIMVKENRTMQRAILNFSPYRNEEKIINNQIQILKSRKLSEKVAIKLQESKNSHRLNILGYSDYTDSTHQKGKFSFVKNLASIFSFGEAEEINKKPSLEAVAGNLRSGIMVSPIRETDIIEVSFKAATPFEAAFITNTVSKVFQEENQLESQQEVRLVKNFLQEQLNLIKQKLNKSEVQLKNYKEKASMIGLPQEVEEKITRLTEVESHYQSAKLELESNLKRLEYIDSQLDKTKRNINMENLLTSPVLDELKQEMAEIQASKAKLIAGLVNQEVYDENNPQLKKYNERLNLLKQNFQGSLLQLASAEMVDPVGISESLFERKMQIETEVQALRPKVIELQKRVEEYNAQLDALPEKSLELARLERATKVDEKIYLMMKEKYEESRITEVGQLGNIQIIDFAKPPLFPISPKKRVNMMLAVIMGLGLGIGITMLREYLDNTVTSIDDVQQLGFSILGSIPEIKLEEAIKKIKQKNGNLAELKNGNQQEIYKIVARMITHFAPKSPIAEAYRTLRTNIQYSKSDQPIKTLLVTSPGPRDGKSTTAVNLAITIAQTGVKTLIIDADLRRPVLHSIFGLRKSIGLSNCIIGKSDVKDATFATEIDNLQIMPCGTLPPNPSELLGSNSMKKLLTELKQAYDFIILDTPPVIAVTDAAVLSSLIDGVLLVLKSRQTNQEAAQRAHELLKNVEAAVLGAVLNGIQIESMYGSYYYYYHYYYYYGSDGDKKRRKRVA